MKIEVYGAFTHVVDKDIREKTVIVVDVLRMSSSIVMAIEHSAAKVIPIQDVEEAVNVSRTLDKNGFVLAGERDSLPLPLFTLGNSPASFTEAAVKNKTVVITTTNGTAALHRVRSAKHILVGSLLNCSAVAQKALDYDDPVAIVCAGNMGAFAAEDVYAAGAIISAMEKLSRKRFDLDDLGLVALQLYVAAEGDLSAPLSCTKHFRELAKVGCEQDITFCLQKDIVTVVPDFHDGIITK